MYVKTTNGTVDTYPYNVGQLRRDNSNTSFPKQVPEEMLKVYGVHPVAFANRPDIDPRTQKAAQEGEPSLVDGGWTVGWVVSNKTLEEVQQHDGSVARSARNRRNHLLSDSDWTQIADAPVNATAWATYRQALRDITDHANFPYLGDDDWPVEPA
jgi:hypothetical protein